MITFSERQLKTPRFLRPVYLVTGGNSQFARAFPEKRTEELCVEALTMACELIDIEPAELGHPQHGGRVDDLVLLRRSCANRRTARWQRYTSKPRLEAT